jgi:hypothetical protein
MAKLYHVEMLKLSLRVRLLSNPKAKQATSTDKAGKKPEKLTILSHRRTSVPKMINAMPRAILRSKFYLKANHANSAVKTPSIFSSNDSPDAGIWSNPSISSTGAITPPAKIAPKNHTTSFLTRFADGVRIIKR